MAAKDILKSSNLLHGNYDLSEECISNKGVFTEYGRQQLFDALTNNKVAHLEKCAALYVCPPYTILLRIHNCFFFAVDAHPISSIVGGFQPFFLRRGEEESEENLA